MYVCRQIFAVIDDASGRYSLWGSVLNCQINTTSSPSRGTPMKTAYRKPCTVIFVIYAHHESMSIKINLNWTTLDVCKYHGVSENITHVKYCFILFIQTHCHMVHVWLVKSFLSPNLTSYIARRELTFSVLYALYLNILRPKQTGRHFVEDISKYIFVNENHPIMIQISLQVVLSAQLTIRLHWLR